MQAMEKEKKYAVLTGDLIKSSKLSNEQRQATLVEIKRLAAVLPNIFQELEIIGPEIFRGDSWQMLFFPHSRALHVSAFVRAGLRSRRMADTRIGIGIGGAQLQGKNLGQSNGAAFRLSGKALDDLKKNETLACKIEKTTQIHNNSEELLNSALKFAARLMEDWSKLEAFAVIKALEGKTHQAIAGEWPGGETTQQNVAAALRRGGWPQLNNLLAVFAHLDTIK